MSIESISPRDTFDDSIQSIFETGLYNADFLTQLSLRAHEFPNDIKYQIEFAFVLDILLHNGSIIERQERTIRKIQLKNTLDRIDKAEENTLGKIESVLSLYIAHKEYLSFLTRCSATYDPSSLHQSHAVDILSAMQVTKKIRSVYLRYISGTEWIIEDLPYLISFLEYVSSLEKKMIPPCIQKIMKQVKARVKTSQQNDSTRVLMEVILQQQTHNSSWGIPNPRDKKRKTY